MVQTKTTPTPRKKWMKRWFSEETLIAFLFILPSLAGITLFVFLPAVRGFLLSFTNSDLLTQADFIGLANYEKLLKDKQFWSSMTITVRYVIYNITVQTVLALLLALMMERLTKSTVVRGLILLPYLLPTVMMTMVWMTLLHYEFGPVNGLLELLGLPKIAFMNQERIIPTLAWINTWKHTGFVALLFFAGLQTIPKEVYEAASMDGANEWQVFRHVTWPLLRPVTAFVLVTSVVGSFQVWDSVAVASNPSGGPGGASRVIFWYITNLAFTRFNMGYAAAVAVALFIFILAIAMIQMRYFRAGESDLAN